MLRTKSGTANQALDRVDPALPLSPGRAERRGFEYYRHDMLSLYAAFNTKTRCKEIHVIADNLSAQKTAQVSDFLEAHPAVHLHLTPTYSFWLNQVELWCASPLPRQTVTVH
jgi:hypothetical protein